MIRTAEKVKTYAFAVGDGGRLLGEIGAQGTSNHAGQQVQMLTEAHMAKTDESEYQ